MKYDRLKAELKHLGIDVDHLQDENNRLRAEIDQLKLTLAQITSDAQGT